MQITIIVNEAQTDRSFQIISLMGFPGTGRTFAVVAAINERSRWLMRSQCMSLASL